MEINQNHQITVEGVLELNTLERALHVTAERFCDISSSESEVVRDIRSLHQVVSGIGENIEDSINEKKNAKEACKTPYRFEFPAIKTGIIIGALGSLSCMQQQEEGYSMIAMSMLSQIDTHQGSPLI